MGGRSRLERRRRVSKMVLCTEEYEVEAERCRGRWNQHVVWVDQRVERGGEKRRRLKKTVCWQIPQR